MQNQEKPNRESPSDFLSNLFSSERRGCSTMGIVFWIVIGGLLALWFWRSSKQAAPRADLSYSTFKQQLMIENIASITVTGEEITGELKEEATLAAGPDGEPITYTNFITYLPSFGDDELLSLLEAQDVEVQTEPVSDTSWWLVLLNFLPFILLLGLVYFFFRRARSEGQNMLSVGRSQARLYNRQREHTTFDDVAGAHGAKTELQEIIEFLKNPDRFQRLGGEIPKGVLLVGPPGTGKTLLARAVAGEARVPFFSITGSNFMEMFVGVGASRVRDLFKEAKKAFPSIVFIDELDSIGRRRGAGLGGGHDEREQTLNQLLSEMDGFQPNEDVIIMAATNRPDILDPALLRAGRFDRQITVDLPAMQDRKAILQIHARNKPLAEDVDLERIARGTPGFSGADLENLLNEAALHAARRKATLITHEDIEAARDKLLLGLERENLGLTEEECRLMAYHEAGHAILAALLPHADPIHKVTIVPRGRAMGVTQQLPEKDKYVYPREYILDRLTVMMGGRAAEQMVFKTSTSGASNDLKQATQLARKMVLDWGMSDKFAQMALGGQRQQVFLGEEIAHRREYSEDTAREVDEEIRAILKNTYQRAVEILEEHRQEMDELVDILIEKEEIPGAEVMKLVGKEQREDRPSTPQPSAVQEAHDGSHGKD